MMTKIQKKIRNIWSKEWVLKLISVCLAVMLWSFVGGEDVVEKNVSIPVEVINLPSGLIVSNKYKKDIEVMVRGPRSLILEQNKDQAPYQIDLSQATPGTRVERIEHEAVPVDRGIDVQRVQPTSIILSLDKLIKKEIPIHPVTVGSVTPGYVLKELEINPDSITITGPQTILSRVDVLKTTPININGLFESVQLQIPLELDQAIVDLIGETSVTADITIGYETVERTIDKVPVTLAAHSVQEYKVSPQHVKVRLRIPTMILKKDTDVRKLFSVTAVDDRSAEGYNRLKVQVVPSKELTVPLEIVSIEPEYVILNNPPGPKLMEQPEAGDEKPTAVAPPAAGKNKGQAKAVDKTNQGKADSQAKTNPDKGNSQDKTSPEKTTNQEKTNSKKAE